MQLVCRSTNTFANGFHSPSQQQLSDSQQLQEKACSLNNCGLKRLLTLFFLSSRLKAIAVPVSSPPHDMKPYWRTCWMKHQVGELKRKYLMRKRFSLWNLPAMNIWNQHSSLYLPWKRSEWADDSSEVWGTTEKAHRRALKQPHSLFLQKARQPNEMGIMFFCMIVSLNQSNIAMCQ